MHRTLPDRQSIIDIFASFWINAEDQMRFSKKEKRKMKIGLFRFFLTSLCHDSEILHTIDNDVKLTEKRLEVAGDKEKLLCLESPILHNSRFTPACATLPFFFITGERSLFAKKFPPSLI